MKKIQLGKDALVISAMTLITVLVWMAFDIYNAFHKTQIPKVLQRQTATLDPKFSVETIDQLGTRISFPESELNQIPLPQPTPTQGTTKLTTENESVSSGSGEEALENSPE